MQKSNEYLADTQRAIKAARKANVPHGGAHDRADGGCTDAEAAVMYNVALRSLRKGKRILKHGIPTLVAKVEDGYMTLHEAERICQFTLVEQGEELRRSLQLSALGALAMGRLHSTHRFSDGQLMKAEAPEWFLMATANSDDWAKSLSQAGAIAVEEFENGGESLDIHEAPDGSYLIQYRDAHKTVAEIFIDNVADYLLFRATYIVPLATLIMETERHDDWQKTKRFKAAS